MLLRENLYSFFLILIFSFGLFIQDTPLNAAHKVKVDFFNVGQGHCARLKIVEKKGDKPKRALFDAGSASLVQEFLYGEQQSPVKDSDVKSRRESTFDFRPRSSLFDKGGEGGEGKKKKGNKGKSKEDTIQDIRKKLGAKSTRSKIDVDLVVISHKDMDHSGWLVDIFHNEKDHIGSLVMGSFPEDYNFDILKWIESQVKKKTHVFFPSLSFEKLSSLTDVLPLEAIKEKGLNFLLKKEEEGKGKVKAKEEVKVNKKEKKKGSDTEESEQEEIKEEKKEEKKDTEEEKKQKEIRSRFTESWEREDSYADCAYYSVDEEKIVTVSGKQKVSEDFQNAFRLSDTVGIHLLVANASHSVIGEIGIRKTLDDNSDSLVVKIQHGRNFSVIIPGDATGVTTDCIAALYQGKEEFLSASVLLVSHHGSITEKTNSQKWLRLVNPEYAVISNGFKHGHPAEGIFQRLYKDMNKKEDADKRLKLVIPAHKVLTNTSIGEDWIVHTTQQAIFSTLASGTVKVTHKNDGSVSLHTERDGLITEIPFEEAKKDQVEDVKVEKRGNSIIASPKKVEVSRKSQALEQLVEAKGEEAEEEEEEEEGLGLTKKEVPEVKSVASRVAAKKSATVAEEKKEDKAKKGLRLAQQVKTKEPAKIRSKASRRKVELAAITPSAEEEEEEEEEVKKEVKKGGKAAPKTTVKKAKKGDEEGKRKRRRQVVGPSAEEVGAQEAQEGSEPSQRVKKRKITKKEQKKPVKGRKKRATSSSSGEEEEQEEATEEEEGLEHAKKGAPKGGTPSTAVKEPKKKGKKRKRKRKSQEINLSAEGKGEQEEAKKGSKHAPQEKKKKGS